jgi:hypothetical protein
MCAAADSLVAESVHEEEAAHAAVVSHESISAAVDGSVPEELAHAAAPIAAVALALRWHPLPLIAATLSVSAVPPASSIASIPSSSSSLIIPPWGHS